MAEFMMQYYHPRNGDVLNLEVRQMGRFSLEEVTKALFKHKLTDYHISQAFPIHLLLGQPIGFAVFKRWSSDYSLQIYL